MLSLWRLLRTRRDLRFLLSAGLVSLAGDWILRIGLVYHVYALTGSTVATGLMMLASFAPQVALGSLAGVFADRWDRKRTMIVADVLLAVGLVPLLAVHAGKDVWIVFMVMLVEGALQQFFAPAEQAMLPRLVLDDQLLTANAVTGQNQNVSRLIGSAVGGVLAAAGGIAAVAFVDAGSFLGSAALIACIRTSGRIDAASEAKAMAVSLPRRIRAVAADTLAGLRICATHRVLRGLMIFVLVSSAGEGVFGTLFAPFVQHVLHGSNQAYGLIAGLQAVGGIAGGLLVASLAVRVSATRLFIAGAIAFGAVDLAIFCYPLIYVAVWPAAVGMVLVGLPGALANAGFMTLFQRSTHDSYRGRVFGTLATLEGAATLVGTIGAALLGQSVGIIPVLAFQGAACMVAGVIAARVLHGTPAESGAGMASSSRPRIEGA